MPRLQRVLGSWVLFALALVVAARLRILHVLSLRRTPFFSTLVGDSALYDRWAQQLAAGEGGHGPFFVDPLYPYFLGGLYRVFGHDLFAVRLAQVGLAVITCAMVGLIARQLAGPIAGNVAAWGWAHFRPDLFNVGELDKTTLGLALLSSALVLALRPSLQARAASGLLFGLATLTRGNLALAALVPVAFFLLETRPVRWRSPATRSALAFAGAFVLALSPAMVHNGSLLTTTGAGANFYLGNNPLAGSGGYDAVPFVRPEALYEEADFHAEAERRAGHALSPQQASRFWFAEGLSFAVTHPLVTARRFVAKSWLVVNDFELGDVIDAGALARFAPVLALRLPGVGVWFPLGVLGAVVAWRRREAKLLVAFSLTLAVSIAAFFVLARIRVFLMPALVALGAVAVTWIGSAVAKRHWRALGGAAALLVGLGGLSFWPPPPAKVAAAVGPVNVAMILSANGLFAEAEQLLVDAHAAAPTSSVPVCALAELTFQRNRIAEARSWNVRCLAADASSRGAWLLLGKIEEADGHPEAAAEAYRRQLLLVPGEAEATRRLDALLRSPGN